MHEDASQVRGYCAGKDDGIAIWSVVVCFPLRTRFDAWYVRCGVGSSDLVLGVLEIGFGAFPLEGQEWAGDIW
jgi:hypothetical protein